jgi:hypothetical protein
MPPFLDPDTLNDMAPPTKLSAPILILSPSSLSHRPQVLESLLSSLSQPHDLQMLDRIALNFAQLPSGYYTEAVLALPRTEERAGEVDTDYNELRVVLGKVLETMAPGGRIKVGQPGDQVVQEAILIGFLVERENDQVFSACLDVLTVADDPR